MLCYIPSPSVGCPPKAAGEWGPSKAAGVKAGVSYLVAHSNGASHAILTTV
jgi:hypothetical protein